MDGIRHVAIIMDGNGRWASERSHSRIWGHVRGAAVVSEIVEEANALNISSLTLYAFSTENWSRPIPEIDALFALLKKFLKRERIRISKNNIRFRVMGDIGGLPWETQELVRAVQAETRNNNGLNLTFAFGYGGRLEIVDAVRKFCTENPGTQITAQDISNNMYVPNLGDVDLLLRTGGEQRISNFLLWQVAYGEIYFTQTKWPDFNACEFRSIIEDVSKRERRFGSVKKADSLNASIHMAEKNKDLLYNPWEVR